MSSNAAFVIVMMLVSSCKGCSCKVAFSSYISEDSANAQSASMVNRDIIIFDKIEANYGVGYSTSTGKFTAPSSDVYGFTWTFCVDGSFTDGSMWEYGEYGTELMSGNSVIGVLATDTETAGNDACSTGFIIKYVSEGTAVYVRNSYGHQGKILSNGNHTRSTFSGWKLYQ